MIIYRQSYINDLGASRCQHIGLGSLIINILISHKTLYSNPIWFPSFKPSQATAEELEAHARTATSPYEPTEPAHSPKAWVLIGRVGMHGLDIKFIKHGLQNRKDDPDGPVATPARAEPVDAVDAPVGNQGRESSLSRRDKTQSCIYIYIHIYY